MKIRALVPNRFRKYKLGDPVRTKAGSRLTGVKHSGIVVGFSKWRDYEAVKVRRNADGRTMLYLKKNLRFSR